MLSPALSGTSLGEDLVKSDCALKALSASLLHPDSESGKSYWKEVRARARTRFGTSKLPFRAFHKVTMVATEAKVFEGKGGNKELVAVGGPIGEWALEPDVSFAFVLSGHLSATCESDLLALEHDCQTPTPALQDDKLRDTNELTTQVFKEVILPIIERELNGSKHFAAVRQIFYCQMLATWFKRVARRLPGFAETFQSIIDSNNPNSITPTIVEDLPKALNRKDDDAFRPSSIIDHLTPDSPAFAIPENNKFYQRYIRLFRQGLYRVGRSEKDELSGEEFTRVYFSGAIDLTNHKVGFVPADTSRCKSLGCIRPVI